MFGKGVFGGMFDLNGDGKMSVGERALEFMFIDEMEKEDEREAFFEDAELDADDYDI